MKEGKKRAARGVCVRKTSKERKKEKKNKKNVKKNVAVCDSVDGAARGWYAR